MKITVQSSKSVKPDYGKDGSAGGNVIPLSVFDRVNYDEYIFYVYAFHPPAPPSVALEAALARALAAYPEWAGRLGAGPAIVLCDAGARFVEAMAHSELGSGAVALLAAGSKVLSLYPSCDGVEELLLVQATRFLCGSMVLGFTMHHKVADGPAMWNFMVAWGQTTRGVAIDPVPVHDRMSLFARRALPQIRFEHRGVELKPRDEK
uniref:Agmatine coumaroyltransferase-2 n=1 Tax=Triticum urartu TaxID=4572 RepID=A0A8R7PM44_TRIUA